MLEGQPNLRNKISATFPETGPAWLETLPALIAHFAHEWSLRLEPAFPDLSYNYVAPGLDEDGYPVVLKLGVPTEEVASEIAALELDAGHGYARLLKSDVERGALLLERLLPGRQLVELGDDVEATSIAAQVMRRIWHPPPPDHSFRSVKDWGEGYKGLRSRFDGGSGPFPARLVDEAESLFAELLASSADPVVLHGDFHHYNVLSAERAPWLAIDPKGILGEPTYEVGPLLLNPIYHLDSIPDLGRTTARRVDQLADELGFDRARVRGWGIAHNVLSAWWSFESHESGWEPAIRVAGLLADV